MGRNSHEHRGLGTAAEHSRHARSGLSTGIYYDVAFDRTLYPGLPLELPSHQHDLWRHSGGGWVHSLDRPAPFYAMVAGPGGKGLNDYWAPEVSSNVVALPGVKT